MNERLPPSPERDWLTVPEAARAACVGAQTLRHWYRVGAPVVRADGTRALVRLRVSRPAHMVRVAKADLSDFLDSLRSPGGPAEPTTTPAEGRRRAAAASDELARRLGG